MPESATSPTPDGRRLRSERSREKIIDAILELISDGNLAPTAQQVSERAGVGIRSVFRHFADMESLFTEAELRTRAEDEALFVGGNRDGTLKERILHAVQRRAKGFEAKKYNLLSVQSQLWRYEVLKRQHARTLKGLRKDLENWLPEMRDLPEEQREAIDAVASFEMWHRLREHQNLSRKQTERITVSMLHSLFEQA